MRCGEREASGSQLHDVMAEATGLGRGDVMPLAPDTDAALAAWLRDHARAIETELEALQR